MSYSNLFFGYKLYIRAYLSLINIKKEITTMGKRIERFPIENKNIMLNYNMIKDFAEVVQTGPMKLVDMGCMEIMELNNGCVYYIAGVPYKMYSPFHVVIVREKSGKKIFSIKNDDGELIYRDYTVILCDTHNFDPLSDGVESELFVMKGKFAGIDIGTSKAVKIDMEDEDILWLFHSYAYNEASLMISYYNGICISHGGLYWEEGLFDRDFNENDVRLVDDDE